MRRAGLSNRLPVSPKNIEIRPMHTVYKNIGIKVFTSLPRPRRRFRRRGSFSGELAKFAPPTVIANYVQIRMEYMDDL